MKDEGEIVKRFEDVTDRVLALRADVTRREDIAAIVERTVERFGGIDILFNNAALFDMRLILDESWDVYGPPLRGQRQGHVLSDAGHRPAYGGAGARRQDHHMSSQAGRRGEALVSHYCATKAAVISYTQSAALALAKDCINVNGIAPGVVDTSMWEQVDALFARYENRPLGEKKRLVGGSVARTHGRAGRSDGRGAVSGLGGLGLRPAQTLNLDGGNWMS